ncbi:MAG: hypothetical protein FWC91_07520 [Defluviitaleaceae bacterium]|nr:hypothetical protein [Defluviitaleaceae bacterium]
METRFPLGFVELESGSMEIYAPDDLFLNFTFENEENREEFRLMMNILLEEYRKLNPTTMLTLIEGEIQIETQYKFYINAKKKNKTRNQDFKSDEIEMNRLKYVEFQNKAISKPPIPDRAIEYFVLSISNNPGKIVNQIWLLASDADSVLQEETFMNYILKDEATNKIFPNPSSIMFISLTKLSQQKNLAGELALFLLGKLTAPQSEEVKRVAQTFNTSFEAFKDDKEVKNTMTIAEKYRNEGWVDGVEVGAEKATTKMLELIKSGLSPEEAFHKVNEERTTLATLVQSHA